MSGFQGSFGGSAKAVTCHFFIVQVMFYVTMDLVKADSPQTGSRPSSSSIPMGRNYQTRIKICPAGGFVIIHRHSSMLSEYPKTTHDALSKPFFGNIHICDPIRFSCRLTNLGPGGGGGVDGTLFAARAPTFINLQLSQP